MVKEMVTYSFIIKIITYMIGFILLFSILQFLISIHPPRYHDKDNPDNHDIKYKNVSFTTSDKIKIKGWLLKSEKAKGTVIVGHGYPFDKGNILPAALFLYPNYNLLYYDHRYFGESSGKITTVGIREVEDVKAAVKFTRKEFGQKEKIALYGFSLSASAMLMSNLNVEAVIADSPYASLDLMVEQVYDIFGPLKYPFVKFTDILVKLFFGVSTKEVSPALAVKDSKTPILLIHGDKDSQIPVENSYVIKEANPNITLWIVKDSDHGQAFSMPEYKRKVKDFLQKNMKS